MRNRTRGALRSAAVTGVSGLSATAYFQTANPGGIAGAAGGFFVSAVFTFNSLASGNYVATRGNGTTQGWTLRMTSATDLKFTCASGAGSDIRSPAAVMTGLTGKLCTVVGVHDGSNVRIYLNGVESGSGTAITGYTAFSSRMFVAAGGTGIYLTAVGAGGGAGVPSSQNIADWHASVKSARAIVDMAGVSGTHLWRLVSASSNPNLTGSADTLTGAGSGLAVVGLSPNWA